LFTVRTFFSFFFPFLSSNLFFCKPIYIFPIFLHSGNKQNAYKRTYMLWHGCNGRGHARMHVRFHLIGISIAILLPSKNSIESYVFYFFMFFKL
jgi:hypothetical protein